MLEYVFFDTALRQRFVDLLLELDVAHQLPANAEELLVLVDEDIDEETEALLETRYDDLLDRQAEITDADDDTPGATHLVGVQYTLPDGGVAVVRMTPEQVNKLTGVMSYEELQALVQHIADAVQLRDQRRLCET